MSFTAPVVTAERSVVLAIHGAYGAFYGLLAAWKVVVE